MRSNDRLQVTLPGGHVQRYALSASTLNIGRAQDNDVILPDPKVSGHHARMQTSDATVQIVDLESRNGTYVNGQRIPAHVPRTLGPRDTVQLGEPRGWREASSCCRPR
jgi:pSer/pThr/pTyr-binding forkhead associated (FHA) protein